MGAAAFILHETEKFSLGRPAASETLASKPGSSVSFKPLPVKMGFEDCMIKIEHVLALTCLPDTQHILGSNFQIKKKAV